MVLEPSWKLLAVNLGVYTEVVGYKISVEFTPAEMEKYTETERNPPAN
jgi:hypothetical protein